MSSGKAQEAQNDLVLSFLSVRQALGWLGLLLPPALILGGLLLNRQIYPSISDSYYSAMKDVFVGAMCAIGVFLLTYRGYDRAPGEFFSDTWVSRIAGLAAIGVALMPTTPDRSLLAAELGLPAGTDPQLVCALLQCPMGASRTALVHFSCAGTFFAALAIFCLVLFTRTGGEPPTRGKRNSNRLYRACGWVLVGVLAAAALMFVAAHLSPGFAAFRERVSLLFWLESLEVWAFGVSWIVKGKALGPLPLRPFTDPTPVPP